jgi:glycosyltransferase involved in cell wall biosynthesis
MNKKKVLYIHHGKGLGGAPLSLLYLIKALDKTKYHPVVLFLHDSEVIDIYKEHGIEIYGPTNSYDFPHTKIWWLRWYHLPYLIRTIIDTVKTYFFIAHHWLDTIKPDIVHLNTSSLIAWGMVARKKNIPVVWHIREPLAPGYCGLRKKIVQHCVKKYATAIIPISKNDAQPWAYEPKTRVVYNAVDATVFRPVESDQAHGSRRPAASSPRWFETKPTVSPHHERDRETPLALRSNEVASRRVKAGKTILFLGGLSQEKGTLVIFKAFAQLLQRAPNVHLLVAGYFSLPKKSYGIRNILPTHRYAQQVENVLKTISHATTILGPIKTVPEVMLMSDVVVFPATVGHFARPVIEAGFMKKPVIASALAPLDELVIDGKTGFLVNPCQVGTWADKLYTLLNNEELCNTMGRQAYSFCLDHFSLEKHIQNIEDIYSQIHE